MTTLPHTHTTNAGDVQPGDVIRMGYGDLTVTRTEAINDLRVRIYFSDDETDSIARWNTDKLTTITATTRNE